MKYAIWVHGKGWLRTSDGTAILAFENLRDARSRATNEFGYSYYESMKKDDWAVVKDICSGDEY